MLVNAGTMTMPPPTPQSAPSRPAAAPTMRAVRIVGIREKGKKKGWGYDARRCFLLELAASSTMRRWRIIR